MFILAHLTEGSSPWLIDSIGFGPVVRQSMRGASCLPHLIAAGKQEKKKEGVGAPTLLQRHVLNDTIFSH
jgi:hypothetical protein